MPRIRLLAPMLGLLMTAACANLQDEIEQITGDDDAGARTVAFECDDDRDFWARFSGDRDEVRILTDDRSYELEYSDRDDGMHVYTNDDDVELRVDNDGGDLSIPGESDFEDCELS